GACGAAVGGDCGFEAPGFVQIVGPAHTEALATNVAMQQRVGIDTRLVSPAELREIVPGIRVDDVGGAAWEPYSGFADPNATTFAFPGAAGRNHRDGLRGAPHRGGGRTRGRRRDLTGAYRGAHGGGGAGSLGGTSPRSPRPRLRARAVPDPGVDLQLARGLHASSSRADR